MNTIKKRQLAEIAIHILFWIAVFYAVDASTSSAITIKISRNDAVMERKEVHALLPATFITLGLLAILFYGNIFWLFRKLLSFKRNFVRFAVAACWFLLIFETDNIAIYLLSGHDPVRLVPPDTRHIINTFRSQGAPPPLPPFPGAKRVISDGGHLGFIMNMIDRSELILLLVFLGILGISIAYFFLKEWAKADVLRVELEASQLSTEVKFLRSQINPHFLFNTLNNLFSMAQAKGNDDLADGISKLSGMMRYMLYDSNAESVPLAKEIEYLEDCITLNKLRYADEEVQVIFDRPMLTGSIAIAPMLFIPFVENAFKHGVAIGRTSGIEIAIAMTGKRLTFTCINPNYSAIKKMADDKSGVGLENVKRRLDLLYPGSHDLRLNDTDEKFIVNLKIELE